MPQINQMLACITLAALCLILVCQPSEGYQTETQSPDSQVKIGIFVESLCPDSRRFFLNQLVPTYETLGHVMKLKIVPFGKARVLGGGKMICQHGSRECTGNRLMACVVSKGKKEDDIVKTIACLFQQTDSPKECIEKKLPQATWGDLEKCQSSDESYQLMIEAEKETGKIEYVPHLTYDGKTSDEIQHEIEHNLKDFVCKHYTGPRPAACNSSVPVQSN